LAEQVLGEGMTLGGVSRRQAGVNQMMAVRLREMWSDVMSVLRIPTFQILILQGIVSVSPTKSLHSPLMFVSIRFFLLQLKMVKVCRRSRALL